MTIEIGKIKNNGECFGAFTRNVKINERQYLLSSHFNEEKNVWKDYCFLKDSVTVCCFKHKQINIKKLFREMHKKAWHMCYNEILLQK